MRVLETKRSCPIATSRRVYRQALLEVDVRSQKEFLLVSINQRKAIFAVGFNVKASCVGITILVLTAVETQACCVELIADAGVVAGGGQRAQNAAGNGRINRRHAGGGREISAEKIDSPRYA